jgi:hypothetical protein
MNASRAKIAAVAGLLSVAAILGSTATVAVNSLAGPAHVAVTHAISPQDQTVP